MNNTIYAFLNCNKRDLITLYWTFWRKTTVEGLKALQPCSLEQIPPWETNKFSDFQAPLHFIEPEDLLPSSQVHQLFVLSQINQHYPMLFL